MSALPDGAILDDEEPQQWHAQPHAATAAAEAEADAEVAATEQAEEDDTYEGDGNEDEPMDEDGDGEEPWLGVHGAAAADATDAAYEEEEFAGEELEEEEEEEDGEAAPPQPGDLTAAFFSEMAASQSRGNRNNKRHRGAAGDGSDSDDDYGVVQSRAFAIPSHLIRSFDPSNTAPPASAEEYLLRVRMEADACPRVKVSDIDPRAYVHRQTAYLPNLGLVPRPTNPACLPSDEWQNHFAADFAESRQQLLRFAANHSEMRKAVAHNTPGKRDYAAWIPYCLGDVQRQMSEAAAAFAAGTSTAAVPAAAAAAVPAAAHSCLPHCPSLPLVVAMDQIQTKGILVQLLQFGTDLIGQRRSAVEHRAATTAQPAPPLPPFPFPSHAYTLWLHTLLLKLDKPIQSHVAASMRAAFRSLSWLRAHHNTPDSDAVKFANMLLTILDRSFGQRVEFNNQ